MGWVTGITLCIASQCLIGTVQAQSGGGDGGGGALGETIVWAIKEALRVLFSPIRDLIETYGNDVISIIIGTPHPNSVFNAPSNSSWPDIYVYYFEQIIPLSLLLWSLSIGLVIILESTSYLFSGYHKTKLKRRSLAGLLGILSWWWMDALARQFTNELAIFVAPELSQISFFKAISFSSIGALTTAITLSVDFFLLCLVIAIYFIRIVILYLFTLLMPVIIALWIPGVGPFSLVSKFMKRLSGFYVPFLFMPVPVAFLFRLAQILGQNFGFSTQGLTTWLAALVIPIVAIVSPFVLFWQAGSIFFMAQSASHHASSRRARSRLGSTRNLGESAVHRSRNFVRGTRGKAAIKPDGQAVFSSGSSRAHAAGSRLNDTGSRLRGALQRYSNTDTRVDDASTGRSTDAAGDTAADDDASKQSDAADTGGRDDEFDALRDPARTGDRSTDDEQRGAIDDEPRYIR
ncbi:hypothetical protein C475_19718 [Halosimplex carlsbadense 2-9-1]|uniref:TrbL/VirB6 plasmid conjugal transfer protein n=1 Tax=Halosimplex carlsbadense 2-9-1 TaxID=797114 RepID=M0CC47_9EURY|nr:hypothetical protein C475_19718 [Halosimplex carlsbadense 2-9-1]